MNKIFIVLSIAVLALTACQQTPQTVPVDIEAEKAALDELFDNFYSAFKSQDVSTLVSYLAEDALFCGTDPSEFWDKQEITDLWTQMLAEITPELDLMGDRIIRVAADGNSAVVVDQYKFPLYTPKIPWRNVYHLVKTDENWMILVCSSALIPLNEDLPKLNDALE